MKTSRQTVVALVLAGASAAFGTGMSTQAHAQGQAPSAGSAARRPACKVEGVWELDSLNMGGRELGPGSRPARKIVARGHWIWIGADARRDTLPMRTAADSLRATRIVGGAGTYVTTNNTYTQHVDFFFDPGGEGATLVSSCQTEENRWSYTYTTMTAPGAIGRPTRVRNVWHRLR